METEIHGNKIQAFSALHETWFSSVIHRIEEVYGANLLALAVYGSYARREQRLNSDLDLLIILREAPKRRERLAEFIEHIEWSLDALAQQLYDEEQIACELSPFILTRAEALRFHPIYSDMTEHCIVVKDDLGIIRHLLTAVQAVMKKTGARKIRRNNTWEWQYNQYMGEVEL